VAIPLAYNVRSAFRRPVSTAASAIGIALVVAILIGSLALASGFQAALVETGDPRNTIVVRKGADSELTSALTRDQVNIVRSHPAVASSAEGRPLASPDVYVLINLDRKSFTGSSNVTVRGVDREAFLLRPEVKIVEGRMVQPGTAEVVVGRRIARRFRNCDLGDRLRFGQRDFTVVGHFASGGTAFESEIWGENAVLMPVFRGEVFQSLTARLRDPAAFESFRKELESDPRLNVDVRRERAYYASQSVGLATVIRGAGILITLIMAVGAIFGAMNTMYAAVGSRTREIAVLLTLGFSPGSVLLSFLAESVFLALLGGILGCLIALPINGIATSTTNFSTFSELAFAFRITPAILGAGLVFAAILGVVGGFFPARRAAKQPLASGMRAL
jgi:putative ABC transport system permease protein